MSFYDEQTEILTETGWILFKDLTTEHKVATLVNGTELEYENPKIIQSTQYQGKLYQVTGPNIDLCVSPNHNLWLSNDGLNFHFESPINLYTKPWFFQKNIISYQNKNFRSFYKILILCGQDDVHQFMTDNVLNVMAKTSNCHEMYNGILCELGDTKYETNLKFADGYQRLALHVGLSVDIKNLSNDRYQVNINTHSNHQVNNKFSQDEWIDYNGKVYSCSVNSGIIYVRRNYKPIFSGCQ
ncbi:Hint (Hedgehog/Intein) domain-containing protein [Cotonvirus japonicus]|uniref:Hint (Hedgehog/Intein) domain-containing protein n=1 Tax=Cotonvirus japonicus TaxID=2811091 RepID=A0ABM7NRG8_9VIRU|nr:Hint (Hedgehog/Intein) domain-containing protein [Cotonvirus japonicus]BCS82687.1 Hint (Hedgehog/Intein) domain-containing protein [Cotonvirus japonicus]